jgi:hypothetical protein
MLPTTNTERAVLEDVFRRRAAQVKRDFPNGLCWTVPENGDEFVGLWACTQSDEPEAQLRKVWESCFSTFPEPERMTREGGVSRVYFGTPCMKPETIDRLRSSACTR